MSSEDDFDPPQMVHDAATAVKASLELIAKLADGTILGGTAIMFDDTAGDGAYAAAKSLQRHVGMAQFEIEAIIGACEEYLDS